MSDLKLKQAMERERHLPGLLGAVKMRARRGEKPAETIDRMITAEALYLCQYRQCKAAKLIGISAASMSRRIQQWWPEGTKQYRPRKPNLRAVK
jgi:transcriptional regulator with AAA-type ATPase domain